MGCLVGAAEAGSNIWGVWLVLPRRAATQQHREECLVPGLALGERLVVVVNTKGAFVCGFWQPPLGSVWLRLFRLGESLLYRLGNIWLRYRDAYSLAILNSRG
nr:hypothetical protein [Tanacetum cinerariifolium]GFC73325.1 hypothetical protein [Tanacetum cinerariifolium]